MVVLFIVHFATFSSQDEPDIRKNIIAFKEACAKETNVDAEMAKRSFNDNNFPDDTNLKCFYKCFLQKMKVFNNDGSLNVITMKDHILPTVDKAKAEAAVKKCSGKKGADICQVAYDIARCLREAYGPIN
ncbi:hypothetical protein ILUMI_26452 [Ignelater luminosus]|uniref:Uncharacterized protein n=1 Tax=Ignelater luminosus TaxID=2038154 RepID=A0A8K0FYX6_IGNLU|nr:hypothetical protein ILUMI_26452 [Ignelater luminosus]